VQVVEFWGLVKFFLLPTILFDVVKKFGRQLSYLTSLKNSIDPFCAVDRFCAGPCLCRGCYGLVFALLGMARATC